MSEDEHTLIIITPNAPPSTREHLTAANPTDVSKKRQINRISFASNLPHA
jgi:hypothetical protein